MNSVFVMCASSSRFRPSRQISLSAARARSKPLFPSHCFRSFWNTFAGPYTGDLGLCFVDLYRLQCVCARCQLHYKLHNSFLEWPTIVCRSVHRLELHKHHNVNKLMILSFVAKSTEQIDGDGNNIRLWLRNCRNADCFAHFIIFRKSLFPNQRTKKVNCNFIRCCCIAASAYMPTVQRLYSFRKICECMIFID